MEVSLLVELANILPAVKRLVRRTDLFSKSVVMHDGKWVLLTAMSSSVDLNAESTDLRHIPISFGSFEIRATGSTSPGSRNR